MAMIDRLSELDLRLATEFHAADARLQSAIEAQHEIAQQRVDALDQRLHRQFDAIDSAWRDMLGALSDSVEQRFAALHALMEHRFSATEAASAAALSSAKEAVTVANTANEKRFESINEFRGQLADQAGTFLPRSEAQVVADGFNEKVQSLETRLNQMILSIERINAAQSGANSERAEIRDRSVSMQTLIGTVIGVVVFVIVVAGFVIGLTGGN